MPSLHAQPSVLLVATSRKPADYLHELQAGHFPRIDYLEAARQFDMQYLDYDALPGGSLRIEALERKLRLDLRLALAARRLVRARGHDVVVSLSERVGIPLALLLPRGVRHVVLAWHLLSPAKLRATRALRHVLRWDSLLVPSRAEADALRRGYGRHPSIVVLPRWVDTAFFAPQPTLEATSDPGVLSVGLSYRDYPTLIEAMRSLPTVRCRIRAGSSWVEGDVGQGDLPANVVVEGLARPDILRADYQTSRFVVVPIRRTTQWSAGATAVLEAQAMGGPVIASDMPGMAEYVLHGETGLLVPPHDPVALGAAIRELWDDPRRSREMGERAHRWVAGTFSLETWLGRLGEALKG